MEIKEGVKSLPPGVVPVTDTFAQGLSHRAKSGLLYVVRQSVVIRNPL